MGESMGDGDARKTLRALGRRDVQRICSGQSVVDLATAVKELVENALDAGATQVEVKLKEFGRDALEVSDNGAGVAPGDYAALARKHCTSKIARFEDIERLSSFGFRGEALSSICELAGGFSVCTRTAGEEIGALLVYDSSGALVKQSKKARPVGTTVMVEELFKPLAVRYKDFHRNIKKHYAKLLKVLQGYALSCTNVRLSVVNTSGKAGGRQVVLATQAHQRTGDNIASVFGTKFFRTLVPVEFVLDDVWLSDDLDAKHPKRGGASSDEGSDDEDMEERKEEEQESPVRSTPEKKATRERQVVGYVSKVGAGVGRSDNDRQFFFINGRPFDLPKIAKATNEVWRQYEMKQKPACVLNFLLPLGDFDVNVTPDKRETFLKHEAHIVHAFKTKLNSLYEPSRGTFMVQPLLSSFTQPTPSQDVKEPEVVASNDGARTTSTSRESVSEETSQSTDTSSSDETSHQAKACEVPEAIQASHSVSGKNAYVIVDVLAPAPELVDKHEDATKSNKSERSLVSSASDEVAETHGCCSPSRHEAPLASSVVHPQAMPTSRGSPRDPHHQRHRRLSGNGENSTDETHLSEASTESSSIASKKRRLSNLNDRSTDEDVVILSSAPRSAIAEMKETNTWSFDEMRRQRQAFFTEQVQEEQDRQQHASKRAKVPAICSTAPPSQGASDSSTIDDAAAAALQRVLKKEDFQRMQVLGQFNLGFIIGKLDSDLFIIDQHASDEKYNYETLQRTTVMHQQPLVRPLPLELTAGEEMVVIDYLDVFAKNGFTFQVDPNAPATRKLKLLSLPFSKHTQFGTEDIRELASLLMDTPAHHASTIRLPKVTAMFASRACRSSIMIGTALHKEEMQKIVRNLSGLDQPWNCPHGRPTLRHLVDLEHLEQQSREGSA